MIIRKKTINALAAFVLPLALSIMLFSCNKEKTGISQGSDKKYRTMSMSLTDSLTFDNIGEVHNDLCNTIMTDLMDSAYFKDVFYLDVDDSMVYYKSTTGIDVIMDRIAANLATYYSRYGIDRNYDSIRASLNLYMVSGTPSVPAEFATFKSDVDDIYDLYGSSPASLRTAVQDYYDQNQSKIMDGTAHTMALVYTNVLINSRDFWYDNAYDLGGNFEGAIIRSFVIGYDYSRFIAGVMRLINDPIAQADARGAALGVAGAVARGVVSPQALALIAVECAALASVDATLMKK